MPVPFFKFAEGLQKLEKAMLQQRRLRLVELWLVVRDHVGEPDRGLVQVSIDNLQRTDEPNRGLLNQAELEVGRCLPETALHHEFLYSYEILYSHDSPKLQYFARQRDLLFSTAPLRPSLRQVVLQKRVVFLELLGELQGSALSRRRELHRFAFVSGNLGAVGLTCLAIACVLLALIYQPLLHFPADASNCYRFGVIFLGLLVVISAGGLGAFFSRILNYQLRDKVPSVELIYQYFHQRVLFMRMVIGAIGALVFLALLASHLVNGDALPDIDKLGMALGTPAAGVDVSGKDLAKLLIWLFVAGFSERLVPSSLDKAVSRQVGG